MPGQLAHTVYCQKFVEEYKINDPNLTYLMGNLIPDIRFLGVIDRNQTHFSFDNEQEVWEKVCNLVIGGEGRDLELFRKGFLFHSYLDLWWAQKYPEGDWFEITALKFYQEQEFGLKDRGHNLLIKKLKELPKFYQINGVKTEDLERWVAFLVAELEGELTIQKQIELLRKFGVLDEEKIDKLKISIANIPENQKTGYLKTLEEFPSQNPPQILLI